MSRVEYKKQHAWICDHIGSFLPGADMNQIHRVFMRKTDHFLQESSAWIEDGHFFADAHGNVKLDFSYIQARMTWIHGIWNKQRKIERISIVTGDRRLSTSSLPIGWSNTPYPDTIVLYPLPNEGELIEITARCAVKMDDCSKADIAIPDWIFSRYKEALRAGVLGDMMMEPNKAYTNLTLATNFKRDYKNWIGRARDDARRGMGHNEAEWNYPAFAVR